MIIDPQILIAIAALCGNPDAYRLTESEVQGCQKYYVSCVEFGYNKQKSVNFNKESETERLSQCILKKQELGGSK